MKNELQLESISEISDDELLLRLSKLLQNSRRVESELIAHIGVVDERRLFALDDARFIYGGKHNQRGPENSVRT